MKKIYFLLIVICSFFIINTPLTNKVFAFEVSDYSNIQYRPEESETYTLDLLNGFFESNDISYFDEYENNALGFENLRENSDTFNILLLQMDI